MALRLAMLNSMGDSDVERSFARQADWGITDLDLKDHLFGKGVADLTPADAHRLLELSQRHGQTVYSLSSVLFDSPIEELLPDGGASELRKLTGLIEAAKILKPRFIRLIVARAKELPQAKQALRTGDSQLEPLFAAYREAVDAISEAGFQTTFENEAHGCLIADAEDVLAFFARLERPKSAVFTWDIQNMWQMGTFPSLEVYARIRHLIGFFHLKGGRSDSTGGALRYRACLEDASWPVLAITRRVIADGVSPVICLNPSHGAAPPEPLSGPSEVERDVAFLRQHFG